MAVLSFSHFMVDLACAYLVATVAETNITVALVIYNFCAFAMQMPLGIIIENRFSPNKTAAAGIALVLAAWFFINNPIAAFAIAGMGNALFHLGGGISVMNKSDKVSPLGVFIAPGALGIFLGAFLSSQWRLPIYAVLCLLAVIIFTKKDVKHNTTQTTLTNGQKYPAVLFLFLVVVFRGFLGVVATFEWKPQYAIAFVVVVVLGKAIGGIAADRYGARKVGVISLVVSAICFLMPQNPIMGLLGVLAFQATMPLTLWAVTKIISKGFGFGLLTFALFLGSIPTFLDISFSLPLPLLSLISLVFLYIGLKKGVPS